MALPQPLRVPEISRLLARGEQLRRHRPAVTYWCEYAAVLQIMRGGLHTADDECRRFVEELMGRLEQTKAARQADEDQAPDSIAVTSSDAGRVMVEAFADETLGRAERVMDAGRVTK
jgi:vacuolar protein sorting-associated protein VTA1